MSTVTIKVKTTTFEAIKSGEMTTFQKEIRPNTEAKFGLLDDEGFNIEDEHGNFVPRPYDSVCFQNAQTGEEIVKDIKDSKIYVLIDDEDNVITYFYKGDEYIATTIVYWL